MTTREFCVKHGIRMEVRQAPPRKDWELVHHSYSVTLKLGRRRMTTPFATGVGWKSVPDAVDVLDCLRSDASGIMNATSFAAWASDLGYDADSITAYKTFKACRRSALKLRRFLADAYEEFMETEES